MNVAPGRIRVLIVTTHLAIGGAETALLELVRRLDPRRYDVAVCSLMEGGPLAPAFRGLGVPVHELGVAPRLAELHGARVISLMLRWRPHVIHARLILASLWARLGRLSGARVLSDELGLSLDRPRAVTWLNRATRDLCDLTISNSRAVAARVSKRDGIPPSRIRVIYLGIDPARFPVGRPTEARYDLITVARLERYKGVLELPDILERLVVQRPGTTLAVVGDGSQREALEGAIRARALQRSIVLLGARTDVPELLGQARVFLLPSHEEGLSVAILEAMAAGLPVVATDVGGNAEAVASGRTGRLVAPRDPAALADAALGYLADPDLAAQHGSAARALIADRFDVRRMAQDYASVYEELYALRPCGHERPA